MPADLYNKIIDEVTDYSNRELEMHLPPPDALAKALRNQHEKEAGNEEN